MPTVKCSKCEGTGKIMINGKMVNCHICKGYGRVVKTKRRGRP